MSEEAKKPFTVTDRRHFTAEGERREDEEPAPSAARAPEPPAPERAPYRPPDALHDRPDAPHDGPEAPQGSGGAAQGRPARRGAPPIDFAGLLLSLGAQAGYLLHGAGGEQAPDLEGARALIELLDVLKQKTEGRRTPEEDDVLEGILYELRMEFVARTRVSGT
jgi:Domain of unknown function (DUF1844)